MIGDFVKATGRWVYQNLFCPHVYKRYASPARAITWDECVACGRTKNWSLNV